MKKLFAIALALMLCVGALSIAAFAAEDTITIHVQVPEGTATPNIWAWGVDGSMPAGSAWPGVAMTADGEWYTFEVAAGTTGMLINTDGDTDKSADITIDGDKDVWVVCSIGEDGHFAADSVSYEAPSAGGDEIPETGDMGLAAVSVALLAATAGLVVTVSKKKEN